MPELPDITVYIEALRSRLVRKRIEAIRITSPFLLRTAVPDINDAVGRNIVDVQRMGKRIVLQLSEQRWLVLHLMIAGRLHWIDKNKSAPKKSPMLRLDIESGSLTLTEAGSKKRASLHYLGSEQELSQLDPCGLEVLDVSFDSFNERLTQNNHTLKRALTSPKLFSGIGNAYSDEILHAAKLSPIALTQSLSSDEAERLFDSCKQQLTEWTQRLRDQSGEKFPEKVTAFREGMSVHGRYQKPCPVCDTAIQRIRYVGRETNYCPRCQTDGKILADRALSRLLKSDWPRTIEELEAKF